MRTLRRFLIVGLLGVLAATAEAADPGQYRIAVTPFIGYRTSGDFENQDSGAKVSLDDSSALGLIINAPAESVRDDAYTEWELYFSRQSAGISQAPTAVDPSLNVEISYFLLGGTYVGPGEWVRPFLAAGIGASHLSPDKSGYDSDTLFAFGIGGGAQVFPASRVGLRLEARLLGSVINSDSTIFCTSGPAGSGCAVSASGNVFWQWEVFGGLVARF